MLRVYFVRHGETDWNIQGRLQGLTDTPLNARGIEQAQQIAERLAEVPNIAAIYTSPLQRARTTSQIIGERLGLAPIADDRIVERNMGAVEGLTGAEVAQRYPEFAARWRVGEKRVPFPDEEPPEQMRRRIASFLHDIQAQHPDGSIVVVTHGGAMGIIMALVMHLDLERRLPFWFDNASLNIVEFGGPVPRVLALNDTCHLRDGFRILRPDQKFVLDEKMDSGGAQSTLQTAI